MDIYCLLLYFFVYGFLGWCSEVGFAAVKERRFVNRGFLNGPICPIYGVGVSIVVAFLTPIKSNLVLLYITSVILVTLLEGVTGWAMDKIFHNKWWDYSDMPLNIGGYVCLTFSLVWGVACVVIMDFIHPFIHYLLTFIPHTLGIILIALLGITMFADLYVTASAIFKFNKRLASMEKIASELHEISDQIGEDIYKKAIFAVEKQEESKQKLDEAKQKLDEVAAEFKERTQDAAAEFREKKQEVHEFSQELSDDLRNHIAELKARYSELNHKTGKVANRLVKAFPKLESRNYKEQMNAFKNQLSEYRKKK